MRSLIPRRAKAPRDPAPSKWRYRYQRLLLTPTFRRALRIGTPVVLIGVIALTWFSNPANVEMLETRVADAKRAVQQRPEFMVSRMEVSGTDAVLEAQVRRVLPVNFPVSSFDLELENMRETVAALNAVKDARVKVGEGGALLVEVTPREPVALWRVNGTLRLIDESGIFAGVVGTRSERLDLPLIAGDGAHDHIDEALALFRRAAPFGQRVRGLVRMGERRWDLVLDRQQRILLPEVDAGDALDRVVVLSEANDLLERDVAVVDMRNSARPTVRMTMEAAAALRRVSELGTDE